MLLVGHPPGWLQPRQNPIGMDPAETLVIRSGLTEVHLLLVAVRLGDLLRRAQAAVMVSCSDLSEASRNASAWISRRSRLARRRSALGG